MGDTLSFRYQSILTACACLLGGLALVACESSREHSEVEAQTPPSTHDAPSDAGQAEQTSAAAVVAPPVDSEPQGRAARAPTAASSGASRTGGGRVVRAGSGRKGATTSASPGLLNGRGRKVAGQASDHGFESEAYAAIDENDFRLVATQPLSTFALDVDTASYSNVRRFLREGRQPPKDAVRIEELINAFDYADPQPEGEIPFAVTTELAPAPWRREHLLLRVGLAARAVDTADLPPSNLVLLIDVSGSMSSPDKLPLLKRALRLLVNELDEDDRIALVVYASAAGLVLPSTPCDRKTTILDAIDRLSAGGSTAGGAGIQLAYDQVREHFIEGGINRVLLATDGDFNVGPSSDAEMVRLIEERRQEGAFLTVLGFGSGNLKDNKMEQLADHGNGQYAYVDSFLEARRVLVEQLGGTLLTLAKDVKLQLEFNPERIAAYRLIGYENRLLAAKDFNDDTKDAGELGAGHSVVALYELVPVGADSGTIIPGVDPLRYRLATGEPRADLANELLLVKLRYKQPDGDESRLLTQVVRDTDGAPSDDLRFAAAVASFGMLLRSSPHSGEFAWDDVAALARGALGDDRHGRRAELLTLVEAASSL